MNGFLVGLALSAGAVAAFNPCGVALFPSYLAFLYRTGGPSPRPISRGLGAGLIMTLGFFVVFGAAGLLVASLSQVLFRAAPFLSLAVAVLLLLLGVASLSGKLSIPGLERFLQAGEKEGMPLLLSLFIYGVAYAVCSLSCALPVFLAIAIQALLKGPATAIFAFLFYALGMGIIITAGSILTFLARDWIQAHIFAAQPWIGRAMGLVLVASGLYLTWYWLLGPEHLLG